jgi:hypothetical protein
MMNLKMMQDDYHEFDNDMMGLFQILAEREFTLLFAQLWEEK